MLLAFYVMRQLWCSSIMLYNNTNMAYNYHTDIYPILNMPIYLREDIERFLDSLLERRELLQWRERRKTALLGIIDVVKSTLGVEKIEMRYTWSAQNNAFMFTNLLKLLQGANSAQYSVSSKTSNGVRTSAKGGADSESTTLHFPWKGLTLTLTMDDTDQNDPVSAVEGEVKLCPHHVPLQVSFYVFMCIFVYMSQLHVICHLFCWQY